MATRRTARRRSSRRSSMPAGGVLRAAAFAVALLLFAVGSPNAVLFAVVLGLTLRPVRRALLLAGCLAGLVGIFALVYLAYRRRHAGPWGALSDERAPWRQYLTDAPARRTAAR